MQRYSVNKVFLVGRLGKDPELRYSKNNKKIALMSLATQESWKSGSKWQNKTEWHNLVAFGKMCDYISKKYSKGMLVSVIGKLNTSTWKDKNGEKQVNKQIIINEITLLSKKDKKSSDKPEETENNDYEPENDQESEESSHNEEKTDEDTTTVPF